MTTRLADMPGLSNALLISLSTVGQQGTAGRWPATGRRIAAVATQSRAPGYTDGNPSTQQGLLSLANLTFVNYTLPYNGSSGAAISFVNGSQPFYALEACARCEPFQGASTTPVAGLKFVQPGYPALASFSWSQQVRAVWDLRVFQWTKA